MSKTMNAEEKKLYDFTKVRIELESPIIVGTKKHFKSCSKDKTGQI